MSRISSKVCSGMFGALLCGVSLCAVATVPVSEVGEPARRAALIASQTNQAVLLGAAVTGSHRLVVVGERGLVLLSDDDGQHWRQGAVPVSVTLTAVRFTGQQGVAVGHGGVVLTSTDGGEQWTLRLDGRRAAELALQAAQSANDPLQTDNAQRLVDEGPDKPFLDVAIDKDGHLLVVGAYGMMFASADFGQHWSAWMGRLDNPDGLHLYAIRQRGNDVLVAGERGLVLRSVDSGKTFERLDTSYKGSLFTAELLGEQDIVVAGLKGSLLRSHDAGATWQRLTAADASSFTASSLGADGTLYLVTQAGHVLGLQQGTLVPLSQQALPSLNGILSVDADNVVLLSNRGMTTLRLDGRAEGLK
ncbi:YCF48-related protein [Pseudomonas sp. PB120]|uniref:WD40/YVTN/BNR-like repeat-containing protein n=1 Tax=Pseudomonas sp. PB120 TaxID=2494700 RepID=UPI0015B3B567|nr:YCF48-related protein [Pseudomonas sp. PB120]